MKKLFLFSLICLLASISCKKDLLEPERLITIIQVQSVKTVPIKEAKVWFKKNHKNSYGNRDENFGPLYFTPDWNYAQTVKYMNRNEITMVPIIENLDSIFSTYHLYFYYDSLENIHCDMMILVPANNSFTPNTMSHHVSDFTGLMANINEDNIVSAANYIENGFVYNINLDSINIPSQVRNDPGCFNWNSFQAWWKAFSKNSSWGHGGGGPIDGDFPYSIFWTHGNFPFWSGPGNPFMPPGGGGGGGGGGHPVNPQPPIIPNNFFEFYFTDDFFHVKSYRDAIKACRNNLSANSTDINTALAIVSPKSASSFIINYDDFFAAYNYYLHELENTNTNYQLKDAFLNLPPVPSSFEFFKNPLEKEYYKPVLDKIFDKMMKDFKLASLNENCNGGHVGSSGEGNTNLPICGCLTYMVEDAKRDFIQGVYGLDVNQANHVLEHPELHAGIFRLQADSEINDIILMKSVVQGLVNLDMAGKLHGTIEDSYFDGEMIPWFGFDGWEYYYNAVLYYKINRPQHPPGADWDIAIFGKAVISSYGEVFHEVAQVCGYVFPVCNWADGILYMIDGDVENAGISLAASLPILGWSATAARKCKIAYDVAGKMRSVSKKMLSTGEVWFGANGSRLRIMLGIAETDLRAHHLIPWEFWDNAIVQRGALASKKNFHMNAPHNGEIVALWRHSGSHPNWSAQVLEALNKIKFKLVGNGNINNASSEAVSLELHKLDDFLREIVNGHPTLKINEIYFSYTP